VENNQTEANINSDKKEKMQMDWTHIVQRSRSNREARIRLESSGIWKKRKVEENVAKDNKRMK